MQPVWRFLRRWRLKIRKIRLIALPVQTKKITKIPCKNCAENDLWRFDLPSAWSQKMKPKNFYKMPWAMPVLVLRLWISKKLFFTINLRHFNRINGEKYIALNFNRNDSVEDWLENCKKNKIRCERIWDRIRRQRRNWGWENLWCFGVILLQGSEAWNDFDFYWQNQRICAGRKRFEFYRFCGNELRGPITTPWAFEILGDETKDRLTEVKAMWLRLVSSVNPTF